MAGGKVSEVEASLEQVDYTTECYSQNNHDLTTLYLKKSIAKCLTQIRSTE